MKKVKSVIFRSIIICSVTAIALIIPDFTTFIDIVGALGAGTLAFISPPLMYNTQFEATITTARRMSNFAIVIFGLGGITLSLVTSIKNIINESI